MGKMDLWYGFACHGIDLLRKNGHLCFIAQNNWTTSSGAKLLRKKVINDTKICQLLDFNTYMVFESASIQTMIMLFEKNRDIDDYTFDFRSLVNDSDKSDMIDLLEKNLSENTNYIEPKINRMKYNEKLLTFNKYEAIFEKIAERKVFLEEKEATNGIHTHHDCVTKKINNNFPDLPIGKGIFVLSSSEVETLCCSDIEKTLIKPYFDSKQIYPYFTINDNKFWIIYTDSAFKNANKINDFPNIKKHLDSVKKAITSDNKPYGLHRSREEKFFIGEKIISQRKCTDFPIFSYCNFNSYVPAMYYVIKTTRWNMKFLTGVLNSKLIAFWLKHKGKMQGSNYQVDKEPLLSIPLPNSTLLDKSIELQIISLVDKILAAKKADNTADTSAMEAEIDRLVYSLYGLTEEEIKIVEGK